MQFNEINNSLSQTQQYSRIFFIQIKHFIQVFISNYEMFHPTFQAPYLQQKIQCNLPIQKHKFLFHHLQ